MPRRKVTTLVNQRSNNFRLRMLIHLYRVFGRHYKDHWRLLVLAYLGLLGTVLVALLTPWPLKLILDHVILGIPLPKQAAVVSEWFGNDRLKLLLVLVIGFIVVRLVDSVVSYIYKVGMLSAGENITTDIRERIFAHIQGLSMSFHGSTRSGDLVYRLTADIRDIKHILIDVPQNFVYRLTMIASHAGVMLVMEWRLALLAFSVLPVLFYFNRRIGSGVQKATEERKRKESDISALIAENMTAMALVQAYGREDLQQARFESENQQSLETGITAMRLSKVFKRIGDFLIASATAAVVYYGGSLALEEAILPGTLILFVSYLKNLYKPIEKFADMLLNIVKSQVSGERLLELVESDLVIQDDAEAVEASSFQGHIEFRHVTFGYRRGVAVLKDLSFVVQPGETVALVGHSGAGKSTLINLLLRFYDPHTGHILIDGCELREFTLKSLRGQMTVVMQDATLFNATVQRNIEFGKAGATEDDIRLAAIRAQAHDFITEMPEGYATVITEGGENLSGGQKQRLNIARGIIRDTPILILDEPATALDAKTEADIRQALMELTRGKTTFIVAHKFSTIANADKIVVLADGELVGCGTHDALMRTSAEYRELYELQFGPQREYVALSAHSSADDVSAQRSLDA